MMAVTSFRSLPDLSGYVRADLDSSLDDTVSTITLDPLAETSTAQSQPQPTVLTTSSDQSAVLLMPETFSASDVGNGENPQILPPQKDFNSKTALTRETRIQIFYHILATLCKRRKLGH